MAIRKVALIPLVGSRWHWEHKPGTKRVVVSADQFKVVYTFEVDGHTDPKQHECSNAQWVKAIMGEHPFRSRLVPDE